MPITDRIYYIQRCQEARLERRDQVRYLVKPGEIGLRPYNCALFTFPLLSFAYFILIMKNDPNNNWWRERQQTSALFRLIAHRSTMGFFRNVPQPLRSLLSGAYFSLPWEAF